MSAVPYSAYLKVVGAMAVLIGFIELGVGAETWSFAPGVRYGCWWGAFVAILAGVSGIVASNKQTVALAAWLAAFASILMFSGMLVDSLGFRRVNDLQTCVNSVTSEVYGAAGYAPNAAVCAANTNRLCGCVSGRDLSICHDFDINHYRQQNCDLILTRYTDLLLVSLIFDTFTLAWVFLLSVMSCVSYSAIVQAEDPAYTPAAKKDIELAPPSTSLALVPAHETALVKTETDDAAPSSQV